MNPQISHERCSELLRPFVRGELDDHDVAAIERHLASCDDCRRELSGVRALLDYDYEGLTGTELVRLERSIVAEMRADPDREASVTPLEPRPEPRRNLAGMALGVAAALVVVAVAIGSLMTGDSGTGEDGAPSLAPESEDQGAGGGDIAGPRPVFGASGLATAFALADAEDDFAARNQPAEKVTESNLQRLGTSRLFQRFAAAYDTEEVAVLQDRFIAELARDAGPDAGAVTLCARNTLKASTGPALPVAGSLARFDGKPVLVLGFIYTEQTEGPLTLYTIWVWPRGSCDRPVHTAFGEVR